jgi:hypothetical protein
MMLISVAAERLVGRRERLLKFALILVAGQMPPAATHAARAARHRWCAQVGRHGSSAGQSPGAQASTSNSTSSGGGSGPVLTRRFTSAAPAVCIRRHIPSNSAALPLRCVVALDAERHADHSQQPGEGDLLPPPLGEQLQVGRVVGKRIIQRGQGIGAVGGLREDLQLVLGRVEVVDDELLRSFTKSVPMSNRPDDARINQRSTWFAGPSGKPAVTCVNACRADRI